MARWEVLINSYDEYGGFDVENCKVVIGTTWLPSNTPGKPSTQYYGGTFSGVYYLAMNYVDAKKFILALDGLGRGDAIVTCFMAPASLCPGIEYSGTIHSKENNDALERYFKNTYLHSKLMLTYKLASQMLEGFSFSATRDFNALFDSVMITMFGAVKDENEKTIGYTPVEDEDVVESVARAVESVMKYNAFVLYGSDALAKLGQKDKRQDEGSIDFVSSQSED